MNSLDCGRSAHTIRTVQLSANAELTEVLPDEASVAQGCGGCGCGFWYARGSD